MNGHVHLSAGEKGALKLPESLHFSSEWSNKLKWGMSIAICIVANRLNCPNLICCIQLLDFHSSSLT